MMRLLHSSMKKNSSSCMMNIMSDDKEYVVSDKVRGLIIKYMEACKDDDHALAEGILHTIRQENKKNGYIT